MVNATSSHLISRQIIDLWYTEPSSYVFTDRLTNMYVYIRTYMYLSLCVNVPFLCHTPSSPNCSFNVGVSPGIFSIQHYLRCPTVCPTNRCQLYNLYFGFRYAMASDNSKRATCHLRTPSTASRSCTASGLRHRARFTSPVASCTAAPTCLQRSTTEFNQT